MAAKGRRQRLVSKAGTNLRTCLGCSEEKDKGELVRLVSGPDGAVVIDYKGNLPGRGAYICPKESCVREAFSKRRISRVFKGSRIDGVEEFLFQLMEKVSDRVMSLISLSRKAGKVLDGREAVEKGLGKGKIRILLLADDLSAGSFREITDRCVKAGIRYYTYLMKDKMGVLLGKGDRGVVGITDESFSSLLEKEFGRLRSLRRSASGGEKNG